MSYSNPICPVPTTYQNTSFHIPYNSPYNPPLDLCMEPQGDIPLLIDSSISENRLVEVEGKIQIVPFSFGEVMGTHVLRPLIDVSSSLISKIIFCSGKAFEYLQNFICPTERVETSMDPSSQIPFELPRVMKETAKEQSSLHNLLFQCIDANNSDELKQIVRENPTLDLNSLSKEGLTPILWAISHDAVDVVRTLAELGIDLTKPDVNGWTPLTASVRLHKPNMVRCLKELGVNLTQVDGNGLSPAVVAVYYNRPHLLFLLHELGADFRTPDASSRTPLSAAIEINAPEMIRLAHRLGCDVNAIVSQHVTPLLLSVLWQCEESFHELLSLGANPNTIVDPYYVSPLSATFSLSQKRYAGILQQYGADVDDAIHLALLHKLSIVWGLSGFTCYKDTHGNVHEALLELPIGMNSLPLLYEFTNDFFTYEAELPLLQSEKTAIQEAVQFGFEDTLLPFMNQNPMKTSALASRINRGLPTVLFLNARSYKKTGAHKIGIVFSRNTLFVCNRGEGTAKSGISIYTFDEPFITPAIIEKLIYFDTMVEFNELIRSLPIRYKGNIDQEFQKGTNCVFTAAKSSFLALVFSITEDRIPVEESRLAFSMDIYKQFTTFCGIKSLADYSFVSSSKKVLEKIREKIGNRDRYHPQKTKENLVQRLLMEISRVQERDEQCLTLKHNQEEILFMKILKDQAFDLAQDLLFQCIRSGNEPLVHALAEAGIGVDIRKEHWTGKSGIRIALSDGNNGMALLLHQLGVDVNKADSDGATPLSDAIKRKDFAQVQFLQEELSADIDAPDGTGVTPLLRAVMRGDTEMVKFLYTLGADLDRICETRQVTALTLAIFLNNKKMTSLLTDLGADLDKPDGKGRIPRMMEALKGFR